MGQNLSTPRIDRHGPVRKTGKNAAFFWGDQLFPAEYIEIHWNTTFFLLAMPLLIPTWMLIPLRYSFTTWDVTLRNLGSTRPPGVLLSATIPWICKSELLNPLYRRYISALFYVGLLLPFHFCWSHLHYVGDLTIFCPHFLLLFILPVLLLQYTHIYIYTYIHYITLD